MTDDIHTPTPEFRAHLEWQIARASRRTAHAAKPRHKVLNGRLRFAAAVVVALAIGMSTGLASAQVRDVARRDSLLESARADFALIALRLKLASAERDATIANARAGVVGPEAVAAAEAEYRDMQARAARAKLNMDEIKATSQPPRDELTAPLVGEHDFVSERIQLDLFGAQQRLSAAEQALAEVERGVRLGTATDVARLEARVTVSKARAALAVLAQRRMLRKEFVQQGTSAEELARRMELAQVQQDVVVAQQSSRLAKARLKLLEQKRADGAEQQLEVLRAQVAVREAQIELYVLARRMKQLSEAPSSTTDTTRIRTPAGTPSPRSPPTQHTPADNPSASARGG